LAAARRGQGSRIAGIEARAPRGQVPAAEAVGGFRPRGR
jgi:hypothetical protein